MLPKPPLFRVGFAVVLSVFVAVTLFSFGALERAEQSGRWLNHTEQVLARIEGVLARSVDAETGTRGFLLTGDRQFLAPFYDAEHALGADLDVLASLTADNPREQQNLELLRTRVASHMHQLRLLRLDYEHDRPIRPEKALEQQKMMNTVRATLRQMQQDELGLRDVRQREDTRAMQRTRMLGGTVVALMGTLFVWVYVLLERDEHRRRANAAALREANDALEHRVEERTAAWATANTELSAVVEREQVARAELERASRLKDEFLMTISHELRTPLNTIHGWIRMMLTGAVAESQRAHALDVIERNTRAQTRIVEDLLDVSRIITGKLQLRVSRVDLRAIVQTGVDSIRPAAAAKSIQIATHTGSAPVFVTGDADRLQQVVWNFLSNALKFTPAHGNVAVRLDSADDGLRLSVSDSGIGIPSEFLPFVFDRFRQGDTGTTRAHGGLGLGLAIARHLVEMHGGSVEVHSAGVGQGTTFTVLLPPVPSVASDLQDDASEGLRALAEALPNGHRLDGCRVLVVDDEQESRELLSLVLAHAGARVATVGSAVDAWPVLQEDTPDVLVSDIEMPGEDGYTLMRRARELGTPAIRRMLAVAVTAHARPKDRLRALQAGYQWHLPKPLEPAELVSVIASLLAPESEAGSA